MKSNGKDNLVAIVATGPSLKEDVIDFISNKYNNIICVSNSYQKFNKALALVSSDGKWWDEYKPEFHGEKYCLTSPSTYNLNPFTKTIYTSLNSGCLAIQIAREIYNFKEIHLFGYDMTSKNGDHYFGSHTGFLDNTTDHRFEIFKNQFTIEKSNCDYYNIRVINYNPHSDLECFEKRHIK